MKTFGKKNRTVLFTTVMAMLLLTGTGTRASEESLLEIANDIPVNGWSALQDSTTYGDGEGIADIYDGGYEIYTNAGVIDALRRLYVNGDEYIEVTVHRMQSPQSALAFLEDRYRMEKGEDAPKTEDWRRFTVSGAGSTSAYAVNGLYFMTVMAYHEGEKGKAQTDAFLKSLNENADKLVRTPK